ncbi:MAG: hypothetical protein P4L67_04835 [Candidatus Pacebacteria bacterium]|nr:hypothetical protein [Candidatus Paceibacterota bacterium]
MGIRYQYGSRRRRILVVTPSPPASTVVVPPPPIGAGGSPKPLQPTWFGVNYVTRRRPSPFDLIQITSTRVVTGVPTPPPPSGGGGSPKPLQPTWLGVNVARRPKPLPRAIIVRTRYTQPPKDGLPNQIVVVDPPRLRRAAPAIIVHPAYKWGINQGASPHPPVVVRRPTRGPRLKGIVTILPGGIAEAPPPSPQIVTTPAASRRRFRSPIVLHSSFDATRQIRPRGASPIVVARPARGPRLKGIVTILPGDAFELAPQWSTQPTVVPSRLKGSKALRVPIVVATRPPIAYRSIPVFDPIVVPRLRGRKAAPWVFTSQFLQFVVPPPRHDPRPHPLFVVVPKRRVPLMWPAPQVKTSILQPDDQRYDKPWDLIAACIAWLRTKPAIVAAFGDVKGAPTGEKFVSDVELPKTDPPYVVFSEPREFEDYESRSSRGAHGSIINGVFLIEVVATEKLLARQMADAVAASLQDAPLVFSDGVLLYLRRTERQFPKFKATGPGGNVTLYKRIIEFEYFIERYF